MREVQYAWIAGINALSGEEEVPQIEPASAVWVTPRPEALLAAERTSHL